MRRSPAARPVRILWAACLALVGRGAAPRAAPTLSQQLLAEPEDYPSVRFFADDRAEIIAPFLSDFRPAPTGHQPIHLALSTGGKGGAFGAGVLVGWTQGGGRPDFDIVTGISAGALLAPFAFVGSDVDSDLEALFQTGIAARLNGRRSVVGGLLGESVMDAAPLRAMIAEYIDRDMLDRIAARHRAGARLLIVTTNIDAERSVVWNMGAIAASARADRLALFTDVLAASASIPAVFPPVSITATANGQSVEELHVDGGAFRQIFFFPDAFLDRPDWGGMATRPRIFAIANHEITARFQPVEARTVSIAEAAYRTLTKASLVQSLKEMEGFSTENGLSFALTYIDRFIPTDPRRPFDPVYMRAAFSLGLATGQAQGWAHTVPLGTGLLDAPSRRSFRP